MASAAIAIGWTAFVHVHPSPFFQLAAGVCAVWIAVSGFAVRSELRALLLRPSLVDLLVAVGTALLLFVGARAFLWATCGGVTTALCDDTQRVYGAFSASGWYVPWVLALIIAPAEELFWRGAVLSALRARMGPAAATVVMAIASSLLLLAFKEPLLALAALPTSIVWGALVIWRKSLVPALVSHALWDLLIFVLLPPT